jgi:hypothetical protein
VLLQKFFDIERNVLPPCSGQHVLFDVDAEVDRNREFTIGLMTSEAVLCIEFC